LTARIEHGAGAEHHELLLENVTEWHFRSAIEAPWRYAEMTEVRVTATTDGFYRLTVVLWSEDAELSASCRRITLDGMRLAQAS
jgi:hypothetical protein